jgi:hypothetical protein
LQSTEGSAGEEAANSALMPVLVDHLVCEFSYFDE